MKLSEIKKEAIRIHSLIQSNKPKKSYKREKADWGQKLVEVTSQPTATRAEQKEIKEAGQPASSESVVGLLHKLAEHKRMDSDQKRQLAIIIDYAESLSVFPWYAIAMAIVDLIETDKDAFYPVLGKLIPAVKSFVIIYDEPDKPANESEEPVNESAVRI